MLAHKHNLIINLASTNLAENFIMASDFSVKIVKVILVKIDFGFRHFSHSIININIYYTMLVFMFSETILTND